MQKQTTKAMTGDARATAIMFDVLTRTGLLNDQKDEAPAALSREDDAIIEDYIAATPQPLKGTAVRKTDRSNSHERTCCEPRPSDQEVVLRSICEGILLPSCTRPSVRSVRATVSRPTGTSRRSVTN